MIWQLCMFFKTLATFGFWFLASLLIWGTVFAAAVAFYAAWTDEGQTL